MKTILVPTDFSACAGNAMEYALELASLSGAQIVILNVYHMPLPAGEMPLALVSPQEIIGHSNEQIRELENAIRSTSQGRFPVRSLTRQGFASEEIVNVADEIKADLIVMGIKGTTSSAAVLMGSVATTVSRKGKTPVLIIPDKVRFQPVRNIAFAFDYKAEPGDNAAAQIKAYAKFFNAGIQVVNIAEPEEVPDTNMAIAGVRMEDKLATTRHHLYFTEGTDVAEELIKFVRTHHSDWLVMIPHTYNFPGALFHKSITKQTAFHLEIPLLTIHG
jgi:nucleotide-binding universal stress UspA family protein